MITLLTGVAPTVGGERAGMTTPPVWMRRCLSPPSGRARFAGVRLRRGMSPARCRFSFCIARSCVHAASVM